MRRGRRWQVGSRSVDFVGGRGAILLRGLTVFGVKRGTSRARVTSDSLVHPDLELTVRGLSVRMRTDD